MRTRRGSASQLLCAFERKNFGSLLNPVVRKFKHFCLSYCPRHVTSHDSFKRQISIASDQMCMDVAIRNYTKAPRTSNTFSPPDSEWIFLSILARKQERRTCTNHATLFSCNYHPLALHFSLLVPHV